MSRRTRISDVVPSSAAGDANVAFGLHRELSRARLIVHAKRALVASVVVFGMFGVVSGYLAVVGVKQCHAVDDSDSMRCRERRWYPFTLQLRSEVTYADGEKSGPYFEYYSNGEPLFVGSYKAGARTGLWGEWYRDGTPRFLAQFDNDRRIGTETWFFDNGNKDWQVTRDNDGNKHGEQRAWYRDGVTRDVAYFDHGEPTGARTSFDTNGKLLRKSNVFLPSIVDG